MGGCKEGVKEMFEVVVVWTSKELKRVANLPACNSKLSARNGTAYQNNRSRALHNDRRLVPLQMPITVS